MQENEYILELNFYAIFFRKIVHYLWAGYLEVNYLLSIRKKKILCSNSQYFEFRSLKLRKSKKISRKLLNSPSWKASLAAVWAQFLHKRETVLTGFKYILHRKRCHAYQMYDFSFFSWKFNYSAWFHRIGALESFIMHEIKNKIDERENTFFLSAFFFLLMFS